MGDGAGELGVKVVGDGDQAGDLGDDSLVLDDVKEHVVATWGDDEGAVWGGGREVALQHEDVAGDEEAGASEIDELCAVLALHLADLWGVLLPEVLKGEVVDLGLGDWPIIEGLGFGEMDRAWIVDSDDGEELIADGVADHLEIDVCVDGEEADFDAMLYVFEVVGQGGGIDGQGGAHELVDDRRPLQGHGGGAHLDDVVQSHPLLRIPLRRPPAFFPGDDGLDFLLSNGALDLFEEPVEVLQVHVLRPVGDVVGLLLPEWAHTS